MINNSNDAFEDVPDIEKRWKAWVIDNLFIFAVILLIVALSGIIFHITGLANKPFFTQGYFAIFIIVLYVFGFIFYFTFMLGKYGQTLGKMNEGYKIVKTDGKPVKYGNAFLRSIGYMINYITLIGWLWILFNPQRRGWHDIIANTKPVKGEIKGTSTLIGIIFVIALILSFIAMFVAGGIRIERYP